MRVQGDPPLSLPWTTPWVPVGHRALDIKLIARHGASAPHTANDQPLGALWAVTIPSIPEPPEMVMSLAVSLTPPKARKAMLRKRTMPKWARVRSRPQVMNRKHLRVKTSRSTHTPRTPSPVLVSSLARMRTLTPSLDSGEKVQATWQRQCKNSSKEGSAKKDSSGSSSSEEELPTDEVLHNEARQKA